MQEWLAQTSADLGRGIECGQIDPVSLTETYLEAIDTHRHRDRIYALVTADRARIEAKAAAERAKAGCRLSLLDGVPISWKDLFDTANLPTEAGSALLKGRVPDADAEVLRNATAAGLVCLGKTHMSELAFSGLGLNPITATPPNLHDEEAVPGGSSSGAAASVAFHLAACGIGSDTGGSVRVPAAWNDLTGLKTTAGRLSLKGVVDLIASMDTIGPIGRSVEDCALIMAAMEGKKPADLAGASLKDVRFAVPQDVVIDDIQDAPLQAYENALERIRNAGASIEKIEAPEMQEALGLSVMLYSGEAYGRWADLIESAPEKMFTPVLERFRGGRDFTAPQFVNGWLQLNTLRGIWNERVAAYDAVLMPSSPILPPNYERLLSDADYYVEKNLLSLRNTRIGNLLGLCATTLPTGIPACGIMLCGKPFREEALLRVSQAVENALL